MAIYLGDTDKPLAFQATTYTGNGTSQDIIVGSAKLDAVELVINGTFDTDTSGWNGISTALEVDSGRLKVTTTDTSNQCLAETEISTVVGAIYELAFSFEFVDKNTGCYADTTSGAAINLLTSESASVIGRKVCFIAQSTITYIKFSVNTGNIGEYSFFDNISVKEADTLGSVDFTQPYNGSGYWLDRTTFEVKTDSGTVVPSGSCAVNLSKVHIKSRDEGGSSYVGANYIFDGIRGVLSFISTNTKDYESSVVGTLDSFNSNGFSIGSNNGVNFTDDNFITYSTLYTAVTWGLTNQGKKYVEAYNRSTGETMIMYEGSGLDGHEIPHSMGVALGYCEIKKLTNTESNWNTQSFNEAGMYLNLDLPAQLEFANIDLRGTDSIIIDDDTSAQRNELGSEHILYGKAKSTTWTIVEYVGTGVDGNFVECGGKPARVILKATSTVGNWFLYDNARALVNMIKVNLSDAESDAGYFENWSNDGFTLNSSSASNADGVSYIALVEFDTNANGGGSFADTQPSKIMIGGVKADKVMLGTTQVF